MAMSSPGTLIQDLVIANRILAKEDVWTPTACQRPAPRQSEAFSDRTLARPGAGYRRRYRRLGLDGQPVGTSSARSISSGSFTRRSRGSAGCRSGARACRDTLAFGVANATKLWPVIHSGSFIGREVPVWDIADNFGDTNLLVTNIEQGRDLAKCLGGDNVALMRGHGLPRLAAA